MLRRLLRPLLLAWLLTPLGVPVWAAEFRFKREAYNPAVLSLSFTEAKDGRGTTSGNSFLDITLIPRKGDPVGKRVELSREQFQASLRTLYRQLSRQEALQVSDPGSASRQLFAALLAPVAEDLQRQAITTLLIAADRGLQAVPFAALHDGRRYFGEAYAFSLTPSLKLTSLAPPRSGRNGVLAMGASDFKGLAPLPLVPQELANLPSGERVDRYLNQAFTPSVLLETSADPRYDRVHVATHAEFLPGGPAQARLYAGTGPLLMKDFLRLRQRRQDNPLELFALSACRTALGDNDSELGFAGLALQAGSRSAIGTLWYVDDVATSAFFLQLYRYLDAGLPKAEALQATRIAMAQGGIRLQGDRVLGVDGSTLLTNLTPAQQRRVAGGLENPFFWSGIELLGTPW